MEDEPYLTLLQEKGFGGWPSLAFMDAEGEVLASPAGQSVDGFNKTLNAVEAYLELKAKAHSGDKSVANDLFVAEMQLGKLGFAEATTRYAALKGLSAEQRERIDAELIDLEVADIVGKVNSGKLTPDEATPTLAQMAKADRIPTGMYAQLFWSVVLQHAEQNKDVKLFERGITAFKDLLAGQGQDELLADMEKRLKALKDG